ncbi:MAG TPA: GNAT family N-acetyltransferase [Longimicrobium sp.]|nr:GNAT family N-acetyltransferase [Longimicrobium sp.]
MSDAPPAAAYIRRARPDDAGPMVDVQLASWKTTYRGVVASAYLDNLSPGDRPRFWRESIERGDIAFVAEDVATGHVVGFIFGGPNRCTDDYAAPFTSELYAVYLLESHQRGGTGTRLVRALVADLLQAGERSMLVKVLEDNPSRPFYQQLGGRLLGGEPVQIGGVWYSGLAYGWDDLAVLGRRLGC